MGPRDELTEQEQKVFEYLRKCIRARRPPTNREGADAFGWDSTRAFAYHVESLEKKGYVSRGKGHRSLTIVGEPTGLSLPVVGYVGCGEPIDPGDGTGDFERVNFDDLFGADDIVLVRAKGTSMIDAHIAPNDLVAIRLGREALDGQTVVVRIDGSHTLKVYRRRAGGAVWMYPCNSKMKPFKIDPNSDCEIVGVFAGVIRVPMK